MADGTRLDKLVSRFTGLSRKQARLIIRKGGLKVDGIIVSLPDAKVSENSLITIEESLEVRALDADSKRYFMLNKPKGYVCAKKDGRHHALGELFFEEIHWEKLHAAGRLDLDATGLVILTDDGAFSHEITSPVKKITKTYLARCDGKIAFDTIAKFASGLRHPEELKPYCPAVLEIIESDLGKVTVTEGRYHEVKRLFELCGLKVIDLKRTAIGGLTLDESLGPGEYRVLSQEERALVFNKPDSCA